MPEPTHGPASNPAVMAGIITISDRASRGVYADESGPALARAAQAQGWETKRLLVVPDEKELIQNAIRDLLRHGCNLILTTGGTGVTARDTTPDAVRELARCELPGFGETMRRESLKITPHAILSRNLAAVVERSLVVCLPGKPQAAVECLGFVAPAIPHCIELLAD